MGHYLAGLATGLIVALLAAVSVLAAYISREMDSFVAWLGGPTP